MNAPAPYTRDTLDRIRKGASASHLGWPQDRYEKVCRQHGFSIVANAPLPLVAPPPASEPKPSEAEVVLATTMHRSRGRASNGSGSNYITILLNDQKIAQALAESSRLGLRKGAMTRKLLECALDQGIVGLILGMESEAQP